MKAENPILYLPVENRNREFDAKLLVACAAAEQGMLAVIGTQTLLVRNAHKLSPGIYLFKGLNGVQAEFMQFAAAHGHRILAIDEEAMGVRDPGHLASSMDDRLPSICQMVLAQGSFHRDILIAHCGYAADQVAVTGNPRNDLLRAPLTELYRAEARKLRDRHGAFVLVNTNTAASNPVAGSLRGYFEMCRQIDWVSLDRPDSVRMWLDHIEYDHLNASLITDFVWRAAGRLAGRRIIVRPHPSERIETWVERFADIPNCAVLREGTHLTWLLAADAVVHAGCTTGVEAALLGRPVVTMAPNGAPTSHWFLSNELNLRVPSARAALDLIERHLAGHDQFAADTERQRQLLAKHYAIADGVNSFDNVCAAIAEHTLTPAMQRGAVDWRPVSINPNQVRSLHDHERMTVVPDEVKGRVADFQRLLGRFGDLIVRPMWESLFMIHAPGRLRIHR